MHRQLSERRQITLSPKILKEIGAKPGQFFEIRAEGKNLVLIPKATVEETQGEEYNWDALDRLVRRERKRAKSFSNAKAAAGYLKKLTSS